MITLPVSALRKGGDPRGFEQTLQLLLPVARCNGLQRFKSFDPFQQILANSSASTLQRSQARSQRSVASIGRVQRLKDAIAQRSSPGLASNRANRHTVEHVAAAPAGETDASVPIRPGIPTPAQRVTRICAETDVVDSPHLRGQEDVSWSSMSAVPLAAISRLDRRQTASFTFAQ